MVERYKLKGTETIVFAEQYSGMNNPFGAVKVSILNKGTEYQKRQYYVSSELRPFYPDGKFFLSPGAWVLIIHYPEVGPTFEVDTDEYFRERWVKIDHEEVVKKFREKLDRDNNRDNK